MPHKKNMLLVKPPTSLGGREGGSWGHRVKKSRNDDTLGPVELIVDRNR